MLHTIQANDLIPILSPAVGWVAAATLVVMFHKDSWHVVCVSCLVALICGYLTWVSHFSIDHVVWLALCGGFISGSPVLSDTGE